MNAVYQITKIPADQLLPITRPLTAVFGRVTALMSDPRRMPSMNRSNRKYLLLAGFLIQSVMFLISPTSSVFAQDKKIIIGYTARDLNNFPLFAAQAKGFFAEAGKNVELVQIRSNIGLAGLLSGSFDYYTAFSSAIQWAAQGSP